MTFPTLTLDTATSDRAHAAGFRIALPSIRAMAAHGAAFALGCAILITPGEVAQAKWFKLTLIATMMRRHYLG